MTEHADSIFNGQVATEHSRYDRERLFQKEQAWQNAYLASEPVDLEPAFSRKRRPWNGLWMFYDLLQAIPLDGKKVLVVGCGYGEDAIRLAAMGAEVYALDLSPEAIDIARCRITKVHRVDVDLQVGIAENMPYEDDYFDVIFSNLVLHHCDIEKALKEIHRVAKSGCHLLVREPYMHSLLQKFRASRFIEKVIYPNLVKWIYGRHEFPVSDDERKLHQDDIAMIMHYVDNCRLRYFQGLSGRLFPERMTAVAKFDRFLHERFGLLSPVIAGGVIIQGQFRK